MGLGSGGQLETIKRWLKTGPDTVCGSTDRGKNYVGTIRKSVNSLISTNWSLSDKLPQFRDVSSAPESEPNKSYFVKTQSFLKNSFNQLHFLVSDLRYFNLVTKLQYLGFVHWCCGRLFVVAVFVVVVFAFTVFFMVVFIVAPITSF